MASDAPEAPPPLPPEDAISLKRIATAHPALRGELKAIYQEIRERGVGVRFTDVLRSFAEQDAIFAQGRSRPGAIVTRARGGQSYHNYGLAVDVVLLLPNRQVSYDLHYDMDGDGIYDWDEIVFVFKHHGWAWGGDWPSFKDKPHFEKSFGLSTAELRHRHGAGDFVEGNYVRLV